MVTEDATNADAPHEPSDTETMVELRKTFGRLDRWRTVIASRPEPRPDADLVNDDRVWPWAPPTSLCIASLGSAREHLHAIRLLIEAGELFPSVASTPARSALMSGSIAVWMLAPDDANERRRRMLTFALEDYRNHLAFGAQVSRTRTFHIDDIHQTADEQMGRMRQRSDEIRAVLSPLGGPISWNLTDVIIPAAMQATVPEQRQRAQLESRWRVMSGAAHGFIWPHFGAAGTTISDLGPEGIGLATITGSVETLAIDYFTAFHVASRGWALFAMRSGLPELAL